jgi:DNA-binding PadR family transcriptional regulator
MDKDELTAQLDWLAKHGFIEVVGISDEGDWFYAPTEKGKNATLEQVNDIIEAEMEDFFGADE